jgi:hypothetical protein
VQARSLEAFKAYLHELYDVGRKVRVLSDRGGRRKYAN